MYRYEHEQYLADYEAPVDGLDHADQPVGRVYGYDDPANEHSEKFDLLKADPNEGKSLNIRWIWGVKADVPGFDYVQVEFANSRGEVLRFKVLDEETLSPREKAILTMAESKKFGDFILTMTKPVVIA